MLKTIKQFSYSRQCFIAAGIGLIGGAIAHIAAIIGGAEWFAFMGAPESIVESARQQTPLAPVATLAICAIVLLWAVYSFSAANVIRTLPFTRAMLWFVAIIFLARALLIVPVLYSIGVKLSSPSIKFSLASSGYVLVLGVLLAAGLWLSRKK